MKGFPHSPSKTLSFHEEFIVGYCMANIYIKCAETRSIRQFLKKHNMNSYVLRSAKEWTTILCNSLITHDMQDILKAMANDVTSHFSCQGITIGLIDSHYLIYAISCKGKIMDIFISDMDFDPEKHGLKAFDKKFEPFAGKIEVLEDIAENKDKMQLRRILTKKACNVKTGKYEYYYYNNEILKRDYEMEIANTYWQEDDRMKELMNILGCDVNEIKEFGPVAYCSYDEYNKIILENSGK